FAVLPSTLGALVYNKTGNYILAGIPVWGTLYLFGSDTSITTWEDLKGKKVSLMGRGMTPDIMFRFLAEQNGLNPDRDMELDYSFPTHIELANAIAAGVSKLGVISEPLVSLVMARNPNIQPLINFNREWIRLFGPDIPFAQTALLVHHEFAENHPELVDDYLQKLDMSIQRVNHQPEEAAKLIVKHNILPDKSIAKRSIPRSNLHLSYAGEEIKGIHEYFKVFYNFNPLILGGKLPDEEFYYKKKPD
ncbi:MAG: ABC transporter substrate-binding protein, partial [Bacteroidota bacterium]